jgi:hypothetical protein
MMNSRIQCEQLSFFHLLLYVMTRSHTRRRSMIDWGILNCIEKSSFSPHGFRYFLFLCKCSSLWLYNAL